VNARGPHAAALALAALGALAPAQAAANVTLKTTPGLKPAFRTSVPDYVSRCEPGKPLRFSVSASNGDSVGVGERQRRGSDFTVDESLKTGDAVAVRVSSGGKNTTHHVRCLPQDFPGWTSHRRATPQSQWYVLTPSGAYSHGYLAIFDARGVPIWWIYSSWYAPWDAKLLPNGNLAWTRQFNDKVGINPRDAWEEHGLDGSTVRVLQTEGSPADFHDLVLEPNGNYLLDTYHPRSGVDLSAYDLPKHANVYDGVIQEITPAGDVIWSWDSKDHIKLSEIRWWNHIKRGQRKKPESERIYDLVHVNSMEPDGDGIIVSSRFLDAVFRIDRATGDVTWKLGGTERPRSLKIKRDPLAKHPFSGQHDARLYGDHTLTVFDNGTEAKRRPRAVRYRIDPSAGTATLLEGFDEGDEPVSGWGGSARKLPGGNWVVNWGGTTLMTERTPSGKRVFDLRFKNDMHSYRAFAIPRGRVTAQQLRQGMDRAPRSVAPPAR
jgi:Arylsulfotransferase (ASST)